MAICSVGFEQKCVGLSMGYDIIILLRHQPKSLRSCTRDSTTHAQVSCIIHGGKQVTLFLEEHFHA